MMKWLDDLPLLLVALGALFLGAAPFVPEPHLVEKLRMLAEGSLTRPVDVFDLLMHGSLPLLLLVKLARMSRKKPV